MSLVVSKKNKHLPEDEKNAKIRIPFCHTFDAKCDEYRKFLFLVSMKEPTKFEEFVRKLSPKSVNEVSLQMMRERRGVLHSIDMGYQWLMNSVETPENRIGLLLTLFNCHDSLQSFEYLNFVKGPCMVACSKNENFPQFEEMTQEEYKQQTFIPNSNVLKGIEMCESIAGNYDAKMMTKLFGSEIENSLGWFFREFVNSLPKDKAEKPAPITPTVEKDIMCCFIAQAEWMGLREIRLRCTKSMLDVQLPEENDIIDAVKEMCKLRERETVRENEICQLWNTIGRSVSKQNAKYLFAFLKKANRADFQQFERSHTNQENKDWNTTRPLSEFSKYNFTNTTEVDQSSQPAATAVPVSNSVQEVVRMPTSSNAPQSSFQANKRYATGPNPGNSGVAPPSFVPPQSSPSFVPPQSSLVPPQERRQTRPRYYQHPEPVAEVGKLTSQNQMTFSDKLNDEPGNANREVRQREFPPNDNVTAFTALAVVADTSAPSQMKPIANPGENSEPSKANGSAAKEAALIPAKEMKETLLTDALALSSLPETAKIVKNNDTLVSPPIKDLPIAVPVAKSNPPQEGSASTSSPGASHTKLSDRASIPTTTGQNGQSCSSKPASAMKSRMSFVDEAEFPSLAESLTMDVAKPKTASAHQPIKFTRPSEAVSRPAQRPFTRYYPSTNSKPAARKDARGQRGQKKTTTTMETGKKPSKEPATNSAPLAIQKNKNAQNQKEDTLVDVTKKAEKSLAEPEAPRSVAKVEVSAKHEEIVQKQPNELLCEDTKDDCTDTTKESVVDPQSPTGGNEPKMGKKAQLRAEREAAKEKRWILRYQKKAQEKENAEKKKAAQLAEPEVEKSKIDAKETKPPADPGNKDASKETDAVVSGQFVMAADDNSEINISFEVFEKKREGDEKNSKNAVQIPLFEGTGEIVEGLLEVASRPTPKYDCRFSQSSNTSFQDNYVQFVDWSTQTILELTTKTIEESSGFAPLHVLSDLPAVIVPEKNVSDLVLYENWVHLEKQFSLIMDFATEEYPSLLRQLGEFKSRENERNLMARTIAAVATGHFEGNNFLDKEVKSIELLKNYLLATKTDPSVGGKEAKKLDNFVTELEAEQTSKPDSEADFMYTSLHLLGRRYAFLEKEQANKIGPRNKKTKKLQILLANYTEIVDAVYKKMQEYSVVYGIYIKKSTGS